MPLTVPSRVAYVNNQWTLFARDPKAGPIVREFILARLSKPELTAEKFTVPVKFNLDGELSGSLGVFKGNDDHTVIVDFDAWGADDVRGRRWHSSQELTQLGVGRLQVKLRLNSLEEVERWVLSFGRHCAVIAPPELEDRVRGTAAAAVGKYGGQSS
jgi:proteasome accessory factor B